MADGDGLAVGDTLRIVEVAERLRSAEVTLLRARGSVRGVDTDLVPTSATVVTAEEIAAVKASVAALGDQCEQLAALVDGLPLADAEIRLTPLQEEAEIALSAGVIDVERVRILAECLSVSSGLRALAAMLSTTDCHGAWGEATLRDVLSWFRGSDDAFARRLADLAVASPDTRWVDCDAETIRRLVAVIADHATGRG